MDKAQWFIAGVACGALTIWLLWISSLLTPRERRYLRGDDEKKDALIVPAGVTFNADQIAAMKAEFQARYRGESIKKEDIKK